MQAITDLRDNRGKTHELAFVLVGFMLAILRFSGKLNLSKIHRMMVRDYERLCTSLEFCPLSGCVSYTQLLRLLSMTDLQGYNSIHEEYLGLSFDSHADCWRSIDGKELRGTIDGVSGQKRGQSMVRFLSHEDKQGAIIGFYQGDKESEKTLVKQYFQAQSELRNSCYTMDALHTNAPLLREIHNKGGFYLSQVKANQKYLLEDCIELHRQWLSDGEWSALEKGHGRLEGRRSFCYRVPSEWFAPNLWDAQIATLVAVERQRTQLKTGKKSSEIAWIQ